MNKLRNYFIGHILKKTDDAFEEARAILLLRFSLMFCIVFLLPVISDIALGYNKALIVHSFAVFTLLQFPFIIKYQQNIDKSINLFFTIALVISCIIFLMIKPESPHPIGISWTIFFLVLSAFLQRGKMRILFCGFLNWLPLFYVIINEKLKGALTWEPIVQKGAENPPIFLTLIPISLTVYVAWLNTIAIEQARQTITKQKQLIDEKNKDMTDSIKYARHIQNSLLPTDKYINRVLSKKKL